MARSQAPAHGDEGAVRILIYSHYFLPSVGGVERLVDGLARGFAEKGHSSCVVTATASGAFDDTKMAYRAIRRPSISALIGLIRRHDVIHLAGPALLPMLLAHLLRKPFVIEHHNYQSICPNGLLVFQPDRTVCPGHFMAGRHRDCLRCNAGQGRWTSFRMWLLAFPRLWLCRRAAANIAVTDHVRRRVRLPNSCLIYYGTATTTSPGYGPAMAADHDLTPCFAYVGRFVHEKGLTLLVEAASLLKREGFSFRLKFIGNGPERTNLEAAVRIHNLQDHVVFTGMLGPEDLRKETADVTAVVMPSIWEETAGMAAIEQMMRGRAVVAADIGGLGEVVDGAGLKFPPGDAVALAERLKGLVQDPGLAAQAGAAARERALALFRLERRIDDHLRLCQTVCKNGPRASAGPSAHSRETRQ